MKKFSFVFFHVLVMLLTLAITVSGLFLLSHLFRALGTLVILLGFLIFFSGTTIRFIFDDFGNEYLVTNIGYRGIILGVTLLLGAGIILLPTLFEVPEVVVGFVLILLAIGLAFKLHGEDDSYSISVPDGAGLLGALVPFCYMLNAGLFIVAALFGWPLFIRIGLTVACVALHVLRVVLVYRENAY